jgi:AcrR family transcriptional regulator
MRPRACSLPRATGKVTVKDIAPEAGVAVPTVHTSAGGKTAILATIIDEAVRDPVVDATLAAVWTAQDQDHLTDQRGGDLLWFCVGHQSWHTLVAELGWTWDESEEWLREWVATALLKAV